MKAMTLQKNTWASFYLKKNSWPIIVQVYVIYKQYADGRNHRLINIELCSYGLIAHAPSGSNQINYILHLIQFLVFIYIISYHLVKLAGKEVDRKLKLQFAIKITRNNNTWKIHQLVSWIQSFLERKTNRVNKLIIYLIIMSRNVILFSW